MKKKNKDLNYNLPISIERNALYYYISHTDLPLEGVIHAVPRSNLPEGWKYEVTILLDVNSGMGNNRGNRGPMVLGQFAESSKENAINRTIYSILNVAGSLKKS